MKWKNSRPPKYYINEEALELYVLDYNPARCSKVQKYQPLSLCKL
uniref:Uncharacterized protein n=1 Tax=Arundo donax TaxID=35708 RepID=A0A0A9BJ19_ARUDO